ncbi:ATP-dependent peptidase [Peniophora sp. CONT]|nr:ATP-dependent peptidase [Peniophora sp. CONT]
MTSRAKSRTSDVSALPCTAGANEAALDASVEPQSALQPETVAEVARKEEYANAHPHDVQAQLTLFQAYADLDRKEGWELVLARWERMTEFDPTSPLLASDKAFETYLYALAKCNHQSSIASATRRRDQLLAKLPGGVPTPAPVPAPSSVDATAAATADSTATTSSVTSSTGSSSSEAASAPAPSKSQDIADAVLSGRSPSFAGVAAASSSGSGPASGAAPSLAAALGKIGADGRIEVTVHEPKGAWKGKLARSVAMTLLIGTLGITLVAYFLDTSGLVKAAPRQSEFELAENQKPARFSDVHGVDEAKDELRDVIDFLRNPAEFGTLGGKLPKGVLMIGPPGTGKTLLARAVAGEAGVPFLFASGSEFDEMFVGVGAKRVRELFEAARKKQGGAIIFIDELDAVGGKRHAADRPYMRQTLNQLLVEMDGFKQSEGIVVIAATNVPDSLDDALVRPGRFDRHVQVPLPDIRGRAQILRAYLKQVICGPGVDDMSLARGTTGFSGADIQNLVNMAALQAAKEKAKEVSPRHLEWARDHIIMGAERKSMVLSAEEKRMTAFHEAGHALVALYTEGATPLHKVTCMPRGMSLGHTAMREKEDKYSRSYTEWLASMDVSYGGRVAEELVYGKEMVTTGASSDLQNATRVADNMVRRWGYSDKIGRVFLGDNKYISPGKAEEVDSEVRRFLEESEARTIKLLTERRTELDRLAEALVEHETLDAEQARRVIAGERLPPVDKLIPPEYSDEGM